MANADGLRHIGLVDRADIRRVLLYVLQIYPSQTLRACAVMRNMLCHRKVGVLDTLWNSMTLCRLSSTVILRFGDRVAEVVARCSRLSPTFAALSLHRKLWKSYPI